MRQSIYNMMFNINRYDGKKFSDNPLIDKRIKATFLLFDKTIHDAKLGYRQTVRLMNEWIDVFVRSEEYELAAAFRERKIRKWKKWRKINRLLSARLFFRAWRRRLKRLLRII